MTALDVCFRYGIPPGETELRALKSVREVYGIRAIRFDPKNKTVRVEFDASRLNEKNVESLLRRADIDIKERIVLA
jgi:copper chaperone CopZ